MRFWSFSGFSTALLLLAPFCFAVGLQLGAPTFPKEQRLSCSDGVSLKHKMIQYETVNVEALFGLSQFARNKFKNCLCSGFTGSTCQSLELELGEDFSVSSR